MQHVLFKYDTIHLNMTPQFHLVESSQNEKEIVHPVGSHM
jgi:hypothetical protein